MEGDANFGGAGGEERGEWVVVAIILSLEEDVTSKFGWK